MYCKYNNFVRPVTSTESTTTKVNRINGNEARKLYLEEVGNIQEIFLVNDVNSNNKINTKSKPKKKIIDTISNHDLFLTVQSNHVDKLRDILNIFPDKVNIVDEYGWSLLMIACQANSVECVEELLHRGIDTSVRDKAGNSARSLVIMNKNITLVNLLLSNRHADEKFCNVNRKQSMEEFYCNVCNKKFQDRNEHLSSTIHNIVASKDKKVPTNYIIPETNKGFQIMLKGGWDKESGLGSDGSGKKYPIKAVLKNDRKGLGNKQNKLKNNKDEIRSSKNVTNCYHKHRRIEIDFRRQFY